MSDKRKYSDCNQPLRRVNSDGSLGELLNEPEDSDMDGDDDSLVAALDEIFAKLQELKADIRHVGEQIVEIYSEIVVLKNK